jgi:hypothetical protein
VKKCVFFSLAVAPKIDSALDWKEEGIVLQCILPEKSKERQVFSTISTKRPVPELRASAALLQQHFPQNYGKIGCLSLYINGLKFVASPLNWKVRILVFNILLAAKNANSDLPLLGFCTLFPLGSP